MAITSTLSRLKNYFIGWHRANYETIHDLTEEITDDDVKGYYAIRSRAVKRLYDCIQNQINNTSTEISNIKGDMGTPCTPQNGNTVWQNICNLWTNLTEFKNKFNEITGYFTDLVANTDVWNIDWNHLGNTISRYSDNGGSIYGWIALLLNRTDQLNTRTLYLDKWAQITIYTNYVLANRRTTHFIMKRKGEFVHITGYLDSTYFDSTGTVYLLQGTSPHFDAFKPFGNVVCAHTQDSDFYSLQVETENTSYKMRIKATAKPGSLINNLWFSATYLAADPQAILKYGIGPNLYKPEMERMKLDADNSGKNPTHLVWHVIAYDENGRAYDAGSDTADSY